MMKGKKGSVTVFILMFMVSLIMLFMILIRESKNSAVRGSFSALGTMWAEAVLAEYDQNLQDRYDIFAFYGLGPDISAKLRFYAGESVLDKNYVSMSRADCSLIGYSLNDTDNFKSQILKAAEYRIAGKLLGKASDYESHGPAQPRSESAGVIMTDLPSGGSAGGVTAANLRQAIDNAGSIRNIVRSVGDAYLENEYAFMYFKDRSDDRNLGRTFLNNEIEYLICGKKSDTDNEKSMKRRIVALRTIFNTAFAMRSPEINSETLAAAEIMTPGPAAAVTQQILKVGWAACESVNDYNLLIRGKKVPLNKDTHSWALDLESIIEGGVRSLDDGDADSHDGSAAPEIKEEVPCVDPGNTHGEKYEDYLKAMLYILDENIKLLRMMDLIQINMRYCNYSDFRIREYNVGLKASYEVNGMNFDVERTYE